MKTRKLNIRTYGEYEKIKNFLLSYKNAEFAMIKHDKDENEPHYHIILINKSVLDTFAVSDKMKVTIEANNHVEPCKSVRASYEYLTHKNNPEKAQYSESEIETSSGWNINTKPREEEFEDIMAMVDDGYAPLEIVRKHPKNGVKYYFAIRNMVNDKIYEQENTGVNPEYME